MVIRQQGLERLEVVPVHHQIVVQARLVREAFGFHRLQLVVGHEQMVILHQRFAFEIERGHLRYAVFPRRPERQGKSLRICSACGAAGLSA